MILLAQVDNVILSAFNALEAFLGPMLPVIKIFSILVSGILIYGIIYTTLKSNWLTHKSDEWADIIGKGKLSKRRIVRGWKQILAGINSPDRKNWKLAVLESDKILIEMLNLSGYKGSNPDNKLKQVRPEVFPNLEELRYAHKVSDRILREPDFSVSHEEAVKLIRAYATAFREFDLID
jgi:hypothetical protein